MQILLPLKTFAAAKQRLSGVLAASERAQFFVAMVEDVLRVLTQQCALKQIAICSRDPAARWLANYYGVEFIDENKLPANDLNSAVNLAAQRCFARGTDDILVVHGDLPLLSGDDLAAFLRAHQNGKAMAITIASDRRGRGSNLLAWRGTPQFRTQYGVDSFQQHCAQAHALNIEPTLCDLTGARCDIDELDDLLEFIAQPALHAAKSLQFLRESGIAARLQRAQFSANLVADGEQHDHA